MGVNKTTRLFKSESEDELENNDFNKNRKRKRILEQYSSSEDEDTDEALHDNSSRERFREKNGDTYIQKLRKIKRNTGKRYYTQTGNIIPAKVFQNKNCHCRKTCIKNYEEERNNTFEKFWNLGDFNKQNVLLYEATERYAVKRRRQKTEKVRQEIIVLGIC